MPGQSDADIGDYRERLYASYVSTHVGRGDTRRGRPTLSSDIVRHLPQDRGVRILDLGSGHGTLVELLRDAGYADVRGVDYSEEQVARATELGIAGVERGDLFEYLESRSEEFDLILAVDVIEHLDKPDVLPALDAILGALAPGGSFIMRVPNGESPFAGRHLYGDFTHGTAYTSRSARQVLGAAGFSEVACHPAEPAVHGPVSLARWCLWKLFSAAFKLSIAAETGVIRGLVVTQNLVVVARRGPS